MTNRILVFYGSYRVDRMGIRLADYIVARFRERGVRVADYRAEPSSQNLIVAPSV